MTTTEPPGEKQEAAQGEEPMPRMSFGDHLEELRKRLFRSLLAVMIAIGAMLPFKETVTSVFMTPYRQMWDMYFIGHCEDWDAKIEEAGGLESLDELSRESAEFLIKYKESILDRSFPIEQVPRIENVGMCRLPYTLKSTDPLSDFWIFMAASFLFALLIASPVVLWQAWAFLAAGLYSHERSVVHKYIPFSLGLFVSGMLFSFYWVVPYGQFFLAKLMLLGWVDPFWAVNSYFRFLFMLTAALSLVFQLPLVMLALQKVGLVSHAVMRKNWRMIILIMFACSAMLTPPDPITQLLMAGPMVLLYILGLLLTARSTKKQLAKLGGGTA